jgi:ABC-2 type transport system ATP-binding protein
MLSTHIMQEVEAVCDRVIIINKGEIVADDSTVNLKKQEEEKQVLIIEFDKEISRNTLKNITGVFDAKIIDGNKWQIIATAQKDIRKELFDFAVQNNLAVLALQKSEQKLEDIFKQLTK